MYKVNHKLKKFTKNFIKKYIFYLTKFTNILFYGVQGWGKSKPEYKRGRKANITAVRQYHSSLDEYHRSVRIYLVAEFLVGTRLVQALFFCAILTKKSSKIKGKKNFKNYLKRY